MIIQVLAEIEDTSAKNTGFSGFFRLYLIHNGHKNDSVKRSYNRSLWGPYKWPEIKTGFPGVKKFTLRKKGVKICTWRIETMKIWLQGRSSYLAILDGSRTGFGMLWWLLKKINKCNRSISVYIYILHVYIYILSGQIIIFHQPSCPWKKGISQTKPPFWVRSFEVTIIWPDIYNYIHIYTYLAILLWPLYPLARGHQQPLTRSGFHHLILYRYTNLNMSKNQVTLQTSLKWFDFSIGTMVKPIKFEGLATKGYWETPCNPSNFKRKSSHTQPFRQPLNRTEIWLIRWPTRVGPFRPVICRLFCCRL